MLQGASTPQAEYDVCWPEEVSMSDASPPAVPTVVALVLCDQVIDDRLSNKKSAIGIFNTVVVPRVPTTISQFYVLASLTEFTGRTELELRLVRDADNQVLFSGQGAVEAPDPLAIVDLVFAMQGLQVTDGGQHAFELLTGGTLLSRRRFQVVQRPPSGPATWPGGEKGEV